MTLASLSQHSKTKGSRHVNIAIAPCALELNGSASGEFQLLPAGRFRATDGRPSDAPHWYIDASIAARLIEQASQRQNPYPIDYEHQTLHSKKNGQPAPRAGGFNALEWREGKGLYAIGVEWTTRAKAMIEAREYLYISPVFPYNKKTGEVLGMYMAAVTNDPALDGMDELSVLAAASFLHTSLNDNNDGEIAMLSKLIEWLGLKADANETDVKDAIAALTSKAQSNDESKQQLAALTAKLSDAQAIKPDPAKFVPIETVAVLQTQIADLSKRINGGEVDRLITDALDNGKLLPAMEAWARELGNNNAAALKAYVDAATPIAALSGTQTEGKKLDAQSGELSADEIAVCKIMGLSEDDYKKVNNIEGAK